LGEVGEAQMIERSTRHSPRLPVVLVLILLAAFLVRGGALWAARNALPVFDEQDYLMRAEALLDGKGYVGSYQSWVLHDASRLLVDLPQYPGAYQPPGYPTFIAAILAVSGRSVFAVKLAQVLLGTLTVALVYWIGSRWFEPRCGLVAAGLCAVYPNLIAFSHYVWSETLFIFLLLLAVALLTTTRDGMPSHKVALLTGMILGFSALTRSLAVSVMAILLGWFLFENRRAWRGAVVRSFLVAVGAAAVIAPWTLRNYRVHDGFVLIDTNGSFNLWRGNERWAFATRPARPEGSYKPPFQAIPLQPVGFQSPALMLAQIQDRLGNPRPTDLELVACARRLAWESIREHPRTFVQRAKYKVIDMWNPTSFLLRHFRLRAYGPVAPWVEITASWAAVLGYLAVMGFGSIGIASSLNRSRTLLTLALVAYCTAVSVVAFGLTRFRLPLMPFIMVFAGYGILKIHAAFGSATAKRAGGRTRRPAQT
jgi:4-amino-4-deoxy-L-arabinose transferase-like glycosyltransferase